MNRDYFFVVLLVTAFVYLTLLQIAYGFSQGWEGKPVSFFQLLEAGNSNRKNVCCQVRHQTDAVLSHNVLISCVHLLVLGIAI